MLCTVNLPYVNHTYKEIIISLKQPVLLEKNWLQVGFKPMSLPFQVSALTTRSPSPLLPSALAT